MLNRFLCLIRVFKLLEELARVTSSGKGSLCGHQPEYLGKFGPFKLVLKSIYRGAGVKLLYLSKWALPPITHASHNNTRHNLTDKGGCKRAIFAPLVISKDTLIFSFSNTWQRCSSTAMAACSTVTRLTLSRLRVQKQQKAGAKNARTVCWFSTPSAVLSGGPY